MKIKYHIDEDYGIAEYINFYISKKTALKNNIKFSDNSDFIRKSHRFPIVDNGIYGKN